MIRSRRSTQDYQSRYRNFAFMSQLTPCKLYWVDSTSMEGAELYRAQEDWAAESVLNALPVAAGPLLCDVDPSRFATCFPEKRLRT